MTARVPTAQQARTIWRHAIAAMVRASSSPNVHAWHREEERLRMAKRRAAMTLEKRRAEWTHYQRAKRARDAQRRQEAA